MKPEPGRKRAYHSPVRAAAALQTREKVLEAASVLLGQVDDARAFTLEAVAKASGVTRLTVYNQFGSRRALLEQLFDRFAHRSRLPELITAAVKGDPFDALEIVVGIFCRFWSDPAVMRIQDAIGADPEFEELLRARHERRRGLISAIVKRAVDGAKEKQRADATDLIFALTSPQTFRVLAHDRSITGVQQIITEATIDALQRIGRAGK